MEKLLILVQYNGFSASLGSGTELNDFIVAKQNEDYGDRVKFLVSGQYSFAKLVLSDYFTQEGDFGISELEVRGLIAKFPIKFSRLTDFEDIFPSDYKYISKDYPFGSWVFQMCDSCTSVNSKKVHYYPAKDGIPKELGVVRGS